MSRNDEVARGAVSNVAFFGEPIRLQNILEAYLLENYTDENVTAIDPRPYLSVAQRSRLAIVRAAFAVNAPTLTGGAGSFVRDEWLNPDLSFSMWQRQQGTGQTAPATHFLLIMKFSTIEAVNANMADDGYRSMVGPAFANHLATTQGYDVFVFETFIFMVTHNLRSYLDTALASV